MESRRNSSRHLLATPSEISPTQPKQDHASVTSCQMANYADQTTSEADTMSIIQRDYLPERRPVEFPPELALLIVRKAAAMAAQFEEQALDEMTRAAGRRLRDGMTPERIARQLGL